MEKGSNIRVFSVEDHPLMREGIAAIINDQSDMEVVAEVSFVGQSLEAYGRVRPDITLMDLRLPDGNGIDAMVGILKEFPDARVIMLTMFDGDAEIQRALRCGARGYLLKNTPSKDLINAIRQVHAGRKYVPAEIATNLAEHLGEESLTKREISVLKLVVTGNRNREIAEKLFISEETVKVHIRHIMEKLYASDRTQAVAIAVRRGIIQL